MDVHEQVFAGDGNFVLNQGTAAGAEELAELGRVVDKTVRVANERVGVGEARVLLQAMGFVVVALGAQVGRALSAGVAVARAIFAQRQGIGEVIEDLALGFRGSFGFTLVSS